MENPSAELNPDGLYQQPRTRSRRRSRSGSRSTSGSRDRRRRLRVFYFGFASLWGFLLGSAAVFVALKALGQPLTVEPLLVVLVAAAGLLALVSGLVVAAAYREAAHRR